MNFQQIEVIMTPSLIGGLILFMGFIIYDLAKQSNAGRFGTIILFSVLGLGVVGFLIKTVIFEVIM